MPQTKTNLKSFLQPKSIAVVGASQDKSKLGSVILQNLIDGKTPAQLYPVNPKYAGEKIKKKTCHADLASIGKAVDLVIVVVPARFVIDVAESAAQCGAKNLIVISAGFGEIGELSLENKLVEICDRSGINLLGPNCLGALCPRSQLNGSFANEMPLPGNICFISQSGAFCTALQDWATGQGIGFSHLFSLGNKAGLNEVQLLEALQNDKDIKAFVLYLESQSDGQTLVELVRKIVPKKPVIVLEPGKSEKASAASSSHTGALAPNFRVLQTALAESGAIQVYSMEDLFAVIELLEQSNYKAFGPRTAIITNAGGVGVLSTDLSSEYGLQLPQPSKTLAKKLQTVLPESAGLQNPFDIIGDAQADRYRDTLELLTHSKEYDQILVLLTPQHTTEVAETAQIIADSVQKSKKPILASFMGGKSVQNGIKILQKCGVAHAPFPNEILKPLGLLSTYYTRRKNIKASQTTKSPLSQNQKEFVQKLINRAQAQALQSLPQSDVAQIAKLYGLDTPQTAEFDDLKTGLKWATPILEQSPVVLKISSPNALHKSDLKGVYLNICDKKAFKAAWKNLSQAIKIRQIESAQIQVQEQIKDFHEIIAGVHEDPNFGPLLLAGQGGIYTEFLQDTAVGLLPVKSIQDMLSQTKVWHILQGVRGQKPAATSELCKAIGQIQQLKIDFPEIQSLDANPILVTSDRAVCVDLKIIL